MDCVIFRMDEIILRMNYDILRMDYVILCIPGLWALPIPQYTTTSKQKSKLKRSAPAFKTIGKTFKASVREEEFPCK